MPVCSIDKLLPFGTIGDLINSRAIVHQVVHGTPASLRSSFGENTLKLGSEYDQEIPQSQTADKAMASRGRATQPSPDTRRTKKAKQPALSSPSI